MPSLLARSVPLLILLAIAALGLLAYWGFPRLQAWMAYQDCVALGRTACG